jgi:predicted dehydrogenase/nucleoside-diphosphate-sugar epimerase
MSVELVESPPQAAGVRTPAPAVPGKFRIALVGCGAATRELHLPILAGHEGVTVTALVDRELSRARELAKAYRIGMVLGDTAELGRDIADAAIVCTPPFHHAPGSIELLRKGLHVMVEKPMATRYADAEAMARAAEEAGVTLVVTVFRRLLPATRLLRGLLDAELLGRPLSFDVEEGEVYNWPTATLGNMRRDLAGGGVLIDFGSHTFDRLLALFDGPGEVTEYRDNSRGGIESDCEVRLRLFHEGRPVEGRVELSRTRNLRNSYRVRCERGTLELPSGERYKVCVFPDGVRVNDPQTGSQRPYTIEACWSGEGESPWYEAFRAQLDDWLAAIREDRPPLLNGASVLPSLKLITDCYARRPLPLAEPWVDEGLERERGVNGAPTGIHIRSGPPQRVLITGATGFIGGRLAEVLALRDGWQVRALIHNPGRASRLARLPVEMVVGDLNGSTEAGPLVDGCDAVVHCAIGTSWGNRREIFDVTVGGTKQLAAAALAKRVRRFVHISTFAVHDLSVGGVIDESTPPNPPRHNDYAESKAEADRIIQEIVSRGLCATTLRLANVYGPFSTIFTTRPLGHLANGRLLLVGPAAEIPCSTVYIDNVVEAIVRALEAPADRVKGELFTVSEGDDLTWADFYGYFSRALGQELRTVSEEAYARRHAKVRRNPIRWLLTPFRGAKEVVTSPEMWALTKRILKTDPIYSLGRGTLETLPLLKRRVHRLLGIGAPAVYHRDRPAEAANDFEFELTRPRVSNAKARQVLGFTPWVPRDRAMELTLAWARSARVVP